MFWFGRLRFFLPYSASTYSSSTTEAVRNLQGPPTTALEPTLAPRARRTTVASSTESLGALRPFSQRSLKSMELISFHADARTSSGRR